MFKSNALREFYGLDGTIGAGQLLNILYTIFLLSLLFRFPSWLYAGIIEGAGSFGLIGRAFEELMFYALVLIILGIIGFVIRIFTKPPYSKSSAPLEAEINKVFLAPIFVHTAVFISENLLFMTNILRGFPPYFWILISSSLGWYLGIYYWKKIIAESKCSNCNRGWTKQLIQTKSLEERSYSKLEIEKEAQIFPNFNPPGRYVRDHHFNCEYIEKSLEDTMKCKICENVDLRTYKDDRLIKRELVTVTPWVKADSSFTTGRKFGNWLGK